MKVVVLLSGGMDSVSALYHAEKEHEVVGALSFDYGSKHNPLEIPFAVRHANRSCKILNRTCLDVKIERVSGNMVVLSHDLDSRNPKCNRFQLTKNRRFLRHLTPAGLHQTG